MLDAAEEGKPEVEGVKMSEVGRGVLMTELVPLLSVDVIAEVAGRSDVGSELDAVKGSEVDLLPAKMLNILGILELDVELVLMLVVVGSYELETALEAKLMLDTVALGTLDCMLEDVLASCIKVVCARDDEVMNPKLLLKPKELVPKSFEEEIVLKTVLKVAHELSLPVEGLDEGLVVLVANAVELLAGGMEGELELKSLLVLVAICEVLLGLGLVLELEEEIKLDFTVEVDATDGVIESLVV